MKNRIKFLSALLFLCFLVAVGHSLYQVADSFLAGFEMGQEFARQDAGKEKTIDLDKSPLVFHASVKSKKGLFSTLQKEKNILTDEEVLCVPTEMLFFVDMDKINYFALFMILGLLIINSKLVVYLMIPFYFFKVVRASMKGLFLEPLFIRRVNMLGLLFMLLSILSFLASLKVFLPLYFSVELEDYSIVLRSIEGGWYFVIAVILLFIAELLKISVQLKEEQELTI